jgi:hypothetical protein
MKHFVILWVVAALLGLLAGYLVSISRENKNSQVEYASQTNQKFYQDMVKIKKGERLTFNGFPTCLTPVFHINNGEEIFNTETDSLILVFRDLNRNDVNKYPYYVIEDNHKNKWSLFRHNANYFLYRE